MTLGKHSLIGVAMSAILYPFWGIRSLWFLFSSTLIDIDHYFSFIVQTKFSNFNVKTMFGYHDTLLRWKHRQDMLAVSAFHTIEFLGLMGAYVYVARTPTAVIILLGLIFHVLCDFFFLLEHGIPLRRAYSFLEYFIRKYKMQKRGIDVYAVHREAIKFAASGNARKFLF